MTGGQWIDAHPWFIPVIIFAVFAWGLFCGIMIGRSSK